MSGTGDPQISSAGGSDDAAGPGENVSGEPVSRASAASPELALDAPDFVFDGDLSGEHRFPETAVAERSYDIERLQEARRGQIAGWLIGLLAALLGATYAILLVVVAIFIVKGDPPSLPETVTQLKSLMEPILTALIGLIGSVIGFYFGTKTAQAARAGPG